MNRLDKEFNRIVRETVDNLLYTGTDHYMEIKLTLLSYQTDDVMIHDYLQELFKYADVRRPLLIKMKEGTEVCKMKDIGNV